MCNKIEEVKIMDLFVCGNGFDLAHDMETNYADFRDWLIKEYNIDEYEKYYDLPNYSTNYKGLELYDEGEFARLFLTLIDDAETDNCKEKNHIIEWKDFENLLGKINWMNVETLSTEVYDKEGDLDPWKTSYNYADAAAEISESSHVLKKLFRSWIRQIDLSKVKQKSKLGEFFKNTELVFLNFNYTSTLEVVYNIPNVKHIHGSIDAYDELIVGHEIDKNEFIDDEDDFLRMEANDNLRACHYEYKKNTSEIILKNIKFFSEISKSNKIYFYGFGFGDSDKKYLNELFTRCQNVKVFLCKHQYENDYERIKEVLDKSGYNGEIFSMEF